MLGPRFVFATRNENKIEETNQILQKISKTQNSIPEIISLAQINCFEEIPETSNTIAENAAQKANYVYSKYQVNCFAEDTGLIIPSLGGAPGVLSARYAGPERDPQKNMELVLKKLSNQRERSAYFLTVIALITPDGMKLFKGKIDGTITTSARGDGGFGYDPIFQPDGSDYTFGEMKDEEKNAMSHRYRALQKLSQYFAETYIAS